MWDISLYGIVRAGPCTLTNEQTYAHIHYVKKLPPMKSAWKEDKSKNINTQILIPTEEWKGWFPEGPSTKIYHLLLALILSFSLSLSLATFTLTRVFLCFCVCIFVCVCGWVRICECKSPTLELFDGVKELYVNKREHLFISLW